MGGRHSQRKLLEKTKERARKKWFTPAEVDIPGSAFLAVLRK